MLKKAFILGLASIAVTPLHLVPHPPHIDWINAGLAVVALSCLLIGLSRRP
jgi:hypothetical protein